MSILNWEIDDGESLNGFWVGTIFYNPDYHTWDDYKDHQEFFNAEFIEILRFE